MIKKLSYIFLGMVIMVAGTVYAAPYYIYQTTILPQIDGANDLGTSTAKWRNLFLNLSDGCLQVSSGLVASTGSNCGSGGGSSFAWPFTVSSNYVSTTTTLGLLNGLFSTASSTFSGNLYFPTITQGFLYTGSNGRVNSMSSTTLSDYVQGTFTSGSCMTYAAGQYSVTNNCIGDTQLAFDTGQTLNTTATPEFAGLTLNELGQGWLHTAGGISAITASTSPTVNYLTATSTTATSTFAAGIKTTLLNVTSTISTSTFANGINLSAGCFSIAGTCLNISAGSWYSETPSGTINGVNDTFTIANTPDSNSLDLKLNGASQTGGGVDYTLSGATITFVSAPLTGSVMTAQYTVGGVGGGGSGAVDSVSNSDSTLTISPTTGSVVASLNLGHANTWTGLQKLFANASTTGTSANYAYFGSSATTSINAAGLLSGAYSSSTAYASFATASTTFFYAGGLSSCNGGTNALIWSNGTFGCNTITGGGSGGGAFSTTTSGVSGQLFVYPNNSTDILLIGSNSSTTAEHYFDPNANISKISGRLDRTGETRLDGTPDTDHSAVGPTTNTFNAGESMAELFSVYLGTDGQWYKTDADVVASSTSMLGVHLYNGTTVSAGQPLLVALPGSFVRDDSFTWTPGQIIYLSNTTGAWTATAPSGAGDVVRIVGYAVTADVVWFDPSNDWLEI